MFVVYLIGCIWLYFFLSLVCGLYRFLVMFIKLNVNWKGIVKDDGSGEELGFKDEFFLLRRLLVIGILFKYCDCCFLFCKRNKIVGLRVRVKL